MSWPQLDCTWLELLASKDTVSTMSKHRLSKLVKFEQGLVLKFKWEGTF